MYLLYLDHSGEIMNSTEEHFVMAGVAVFERQVFYLEKELDEIQGEYLPDVKDRVEFHASVMRKRKTPPWDQLAWDTIQRMMTAVYEVIGHAREPGFCIFGEVLEKSHVVAGFGDAMSQALQQKKEVAARLKQARGEEKAKSRQELAEVKAELAELTSKILSKAFERLCTQFEFFLRRFYDVNNPERQQRGIMVFDHASYERDLELLMEYFRQQGTGVTQIYNVIDAPFFARSGSTRFLQLADFVSYALYRRYESKDTSYFNLIAHRFDQVGGVCHGLAHLTSDHHCMCPACLTRRIGRSGSAT